jgi:methylmalonyl-CoA mutase N-terminal domain/subunit
VQAIGFMKNEIEESAWGYGERYRLGQDIVVGVNKYVTEDVEVPDTLKVDQAQEDAQVERLKAFKADRDAELVEKRLEELREAARGTDNLLPYIRQALKDHCSLGETCGAMRDVFGEYQPES